MESLIIFGAQYLYLVIVAIALGFVFRLPKEQAQRFVTFALLALPLTYIVAKLTSLGFYNPRPFVVEDLVPLISHAPDNGFPSDHTLLSSAIAAVVWCFHRSLGSLLLAVAFLVGMARVLAGVHHVSDVLGSILIATIVTAVTKRYLLPYFFK